MKVSIKDITSKAKKYLPERDCKKIRNAFEFAEKAYQGETTVWGVPYTENYLHSALHLIDLRTDAETLCACFLQKIPFFDESALNEIEVEFGKDVRKLTENLSQIIKFSEKNESSLLMPSKEYSQTLVADALRRMFLAMAKDLRVIIVRLAEKLNRLNSLHYLEPEVRKLYVQEVLDIFVPIADRLGIFQFKRKIEDLCFAELEKEIYKNLQAQFKKGGETHAKGLQIMQQAIKKFLQEHGIKAEIEGRIKGYYSTYQKMKRKNISRIDEVLDLFAIRVILENQEDCYRVLGLIHNKWQPIPGKFKDYIAAPKVNGYRSLHTTAVGIAKQVSHKSVEIQIRTEEMHQEAQFGIAAHWWYKESPVEKRTFSGDMQGSQDKLQKNYEEKVQWVKNLVDLHESLKNNNEFSDALKLNLFSDRIFVLTPHGDVKDLPKGATPIDFAYEIHTNLGHHCVRAKVNGENVPLDYALKNGDAVEIDTDPKKRPNRYWLSFIKTNKAREKIRSWIKSLKSGDSAKEGKRLLNKHLKNLNKAELDSENLILRNFGGKRLTVKEREEILEDIGRGRTSPLAILKKLYPDDAFFRKPVESLKWKERKRGQRSLQPRILVTGETGYETKLPQCCKPQPGDPIVGYITRGGFVSVHKQHCQLLNGLSRNRLLNVSWEGYAPQGIPTTIRIMLNDKNNDALYEITKVIREAELEMTDFNKTMEENKDILTFEIEVVDYEQLDLIINKLEILECVEKAENVYRLPLSKRKKRNL